MILKAISIGLGAALMLGLLKLVDSNHAEPAFVVLGYMAVTAFRVTAVAAAWLLAVRYLHSRKHNS